MEGNEVSAPILLRERVYQLRQDVTGNHRRRQLVADIGESVCELCGTRRAPSERQGGRLLDGRHGV